MKNMKKKTFLEVVSYTKKQCLEYTKLVIEYKFDYLMSTIKIIAEESRKFMNFSETIKLFL